MNWQRLIAIDPSLTASGWVLFTLRDAQPMCCGVISPPGPAENLSLRLDYLQRLVQKLFTELELGENDVLVCEGPAPLVLNPQSALKVERVRSIFESVARVHGVSVPGRLNPRTVQAELLGLRGKQLARAHVKEQARCVCERLFGKSLQECLYERAEKPPKKLPQDIIDAALIGSVAISRVQMSIRLQHPLEELFSPRPLLRQSGSRNSRRVQWSEQELRKKMNS